MHQTHWINIWKLEFNAEKRKTINFRKKNSHTQYHMNCSDGSHKAIFSYPTERNLGILVDNELNFHLCAQATTTKANQKNIH